MQLISGKRLEPQKVVIYGPEGIGKSTLAAKFPAPVFLDAEGGTNHLDVVRFPKPGTYNDVIKAVEFLVAGDHQFKTLVIDTADWTEKLMIEFMCKRDSKDSIEGYGYGKGYKHAEDEFMKLLSRLDDLRAKRGINIVFLAHAMVRKFELPDEAGAFDKYELKLTKNVAPRMKEWADMLLFINWKTYVQRQKDGKERLGGGKERVMYTSHSNTFDAKNRNNLPEELPCEFSALVHVVPGGSVQVENTIAEEPKTAAVPETNTGTAAESEQSAKQPENPAAPRSETAFNPELYNMIQFSGITDEELKGYLLAKGFLKDPSLGFDNLAESFVQKMLQPKNWERVITFINEKRAEQAKQ